MIYLIGAISIFSLVLNVLIYRRITATYPVGEVGELTVTPVQLEELPVEEAQPLPPVNTPKVDEVYQGWRNVRDIPWTEPIKTPSQITPRKTGPMERPDGFV